MSSKRVLTPTQSRQDDAHAPLKILHISRSLRWNLPVSDSTNLSRADEDTTLCYVPRSEDDLTACASVSSGLQTKSISQLSSFLQLSLPQLPEIPDWYEDDSERPTQEPEAPDPETLDTPPSDYHSLADFHPASLCCQNASSESNHLVFQARSPPLSNLKHKPEPPSTVSAAPQGHGRPRAEPQRHRSHSLDLTDRRPASLTYTTPPDAGWGHGLGSPFCPSPLSPAAHLAPIHSGTDFSLHNEPVQSMSPLSVTADLNQTPLSLRRAEALAVWRPQGPTPPTDAGTAPSSLSDWDVLSLEQPFPSTASIWVLDAPLPHSAWRLHPGMESRYRPHGDSGPVGIPKWSLEEQITIAVLEAMDSRDMRSAGRAACSRLGGGGSRKGTFRRLLGRIWRRTALGDYS
ncbi:hypothetical protein B0H17DRAFT_1044846 [Mycena rosella]|uniref:Uncharacterized protein n=1 Tax=Mycena rosella TaxID=1033263 RepID=A0AAD7DY51_MYCRO|nr:hypothetical protein B0H17DRAFT_1044846 [Mycena rosella]